MKCDCFVQERLEQEEELKVKEAELLRGNPLLNNPASFNVKRRFESQYFPSKPKCLLFLLTLLVFCHDLIFLGFLYAPVWLRWDDDVVFKNQARGEAKAPKRFINDTIRNDFHRKFLHKYMK